MRENFPIALGFVLRHEGGYVNDSDDPGKETIYGISRKYHPEAWKNGRPTMEQAKQIYLEQYWIPSCDILSFPKDIIYFDTAVNMGRDTATMILSDADTWQSYLFRRVKAYHDKVVMSQKKIKFFFGWMERVLDLYRLIKDEEKRREGK